MSQKRHEGNKIKSNNLHIFPFQIFFKPPIPCYNLYFFIFLLLLMVQIIHLWMRFVLILMPCVLSCCNTMVLDILV